MRANSGKAEAITVNANPKSVVVVGGGVSGIAASVALAEAGLTVTLIEKRPLLGGRASSHVDAATGDLVDECQHGTMRCCTNLTDLLTRLGVADQIRYHDAIQFIDSDGKRSVIKGCGLPAPGHTSVSFLTFRSLGIADKICIGRAMLAMVLSRPDPSFESTTIAEWFVRTHQTERAIKRFWAPILISACNETIDRISITHAFKIFRDGFLMNDQAFHFGVPRQPLAGLYSKPAIDYLEKRGSFVRSKTTVDAIKVCGETDPKIRALVLQGGEEVSADYYVLALQSDLLLKLLPGSITGASDYWKAIPAIELSPIIGVHLWFDQPIACPEALATLDRDTEWIFNKSRNFDSAGAGGTYLSAVISASHRFASTPKEDILRRVLDDVRAVLPQTASATLVRSQVVKWPKATFSPLPGVEACRPDQRTPVTNLYLAGEWTQTGWPSTMESAAISGYRAAEYILAAEGRTETFQAKPLQPGKLAKLLDGKMAFK